MRFFKLLLISIAAFFLILLGISAMFPNHLRISRAIDISVPAEQAVKEISDLDSWKTWNGFVKNTPLTHLTISSPATGAGAFIRSDQLTITVSTSNSDSMTTRWQQKNGKSFKSGYSILRLRQGTTTVQWYFDFQFRWYPWEKLSSLLYETQLGPLMEESLSAFKLKLENFK